MIHLDQNADIVVRTLNKYQYSPHVVKMEARCFSQLKHFMKREGQLTLELTAAQKWCAEHAAKTAKRPFSYALLRLADVYEYGRVLSSHLVIHGELSVEFSDAVNSFIDSLSPKEFIDSSIGRYREACVMFFRFCQLNDVFCLDQIDFALLGKYHDYIVESGRFGAHEGCTERMFLYFAESRHMKYGFSLYLHYARNGRCSSAGALSEKGCAAIEKLRNVRGTISSREFCKSIPVFIDSVESHKYAGNTTHAHYYFLRVLGIFLECENLDYSRKAADIWASDMCTQFFGKSRVTAFSHTMDLYDAFIADNYYAPKSVHATYKSTYLTLPDWCKSAIDSFAMARRKEGLRESTVRKQTYPCAKFCGYIVSEGLASFENLRTEHIKAFNLQDKHQSIAGKNHTNQVLYRFLIHMELHGIIQTRLHDALPCCTARGDKVVTVLSGEDKAKLEAYCNNASTPIAIRDAAMIRLGMNTALRGIDVISLRIRDIDWKNRCIKIIQKKTGVEHLHPVDTGTLNSIFRYLKEGRSKNAVTDKIFVGSRAPYGPLAGSESCRNALRRTGISAADFHRLRRSYATDSLKGGATFRETAELLGHSDIGSVHKYTLLDDGRMRFCPLSMEDTGLDMNRRRRYEG